MEGEVRKNAASLQLHHEHSGILDRLLSLLMTAESILAAQIAPELCI